MTFLLRSPLNIRVSSNRCWNNESWVTKRFSMIQHSKQKQNYVHIYRLLVRGTPWLQLDRKRQSLKVMPEIWKTDEALKRWQYWCSVKSKANVKYIAVCGPKCTKELGPQDLICPTCRKTIWHPSCLEQRFKLFQLDVPSFEGKRDV